MLCWPAPIALELFEPVAGRDPQVFQLLGGIDGHELAKHDLKVGREPPDGLARERARSVSRSAKLLITWNSNAARP